MAVIYDSGTRTDRMEVVLDRIDDNAAAGILKIYTAGLALLLVEIDLADPAGSVSGDVLTLTVPRSGTAVGTGTAAEATITNGADAVRVSGLTAGVAATNIILDSATITSGQTCTMTAGSLTHNTSGT